MTNQLAVAPFAISDWVKSLAAIPVADFTLETVHQYLLMHPIQPESLSQYCYFSKGNYTRNLIFKNELFEVMTVCWEVGQASRIHNHRDQHCWMAVPVGRLRVQNYRVEDRDASCGTCKLVPTDAMLMDPNHPAFVNPVEPVHEVLNLAEFGERAVSVHVYSKPFDTCEIYLRDKGTYADVPLFYTSEYGVLHPDAKLL
ncbi:MAG TPA: cysteine dioxygenase family protein [Candidatus Dormibacteraeota bacterium]|nr:cysteine dioxygenase family protein [Candidatus Dormibacteraeota bacterium]